MMTMLSRIRLWSRPSQKRMSRWLRCSRIRSQRAVQRLQRRERVVSQVASARTPTCALHRPDRQRLRPPHPQRRRETHRAMRRLRPTLLPAGRRSSSASPSRRWTLAARMVNSRSRKLKMRSSSKQRRRSDRRRRVADRRMRAQRNRRARSTPKRRCVLRRSAHTIPSLPAPPHRRRFCSAADTSTALRSERLIRPPVVPLRPSPLTPSSRCRTFNPPPFSRPPA